VGQNVRKHRYIADERSLAI